MAMAFLFNATLNVGNNPQRTVAADVNGDGYGFNDRK